MEVLNEWKHSAISNITMDAKVYNSRNSQVSQATNMKTLYSQANEKDKSHMIAYNGSAKSVHATLVNQTHNKCETRIEYYSSLIQPSYDRSLFNSGQGSIYPYVSDFSQVNLHECLNIDNFKMSQSSTTGCVAQTENIYGLGIRSGTASNPVINDEVKEPLWIKSQRKYISLHECLPILNEEDINDKRLQRPQQKKENYKVSIQMRSPHVIPKMNINF